MLSAYPKGAPLMDAGRMDPRDKPWDDGCEGKRSQTFDRINVPLVPPKPKLLDMTWVSSPS